MTETLAPTPAPLDKPRGRVRWIVCALLFAAVALSYIDRLVLPTLKPELQARYDWSEQGYADLAIAFQAAYGIAYVLFGRFVDRVGARIGYAVAVTLWTIGHVAHCAVHQRRRDDLGAAAAGRRGKRGAFPAALAATSEWFPQRERALAIGIFNAGSNVGAILTPLVGAGDRGRVRLEDGVRRDRRADPGVAGRLARLLSQPAPAPPRHGGRTRLDRGGPDAPRPADPLAHIAPPAPDLGLYGRPLPDRPDLVDLPVLAARLLQPAIWREDARLRPAAGRGLCAGGRGVDRGRLVIRRACWGAGGAPTARARPRWRPARCSRCRSSSRRRPRACGGRCWRSGWPAPVTRAFPPMSSPSRRPVPARHGRVGDRPGRTGRRGRRHDDGEVRRHDPGGVGGYGPIFAVAGCAYFVALLVILLLVPTYAPVDPARLAADRS